MGPLWTLLQIHPSLLLTSMTTVACWHKWWPNVQQRYPLYTLWQISLYVWCVYLAKILNSTFWKNIKEKNTSQHREKFRSMLHQSYHYLTKGYVCIYVCMYPHNKKASLNMPKKQLLLQSRPILEIKGSERS